ncbi:anti-repressor SinI family protein [Salipaludibacillus daqingensis]|uniref:anti-repressor SinI family protein n=1 Tax=Salipaludibacillus daqingensis TaxID=3041001 RepID=UPI0024752479|nr:anti-repressor SinI family protein [Salipaludibacillus daqingensis]
MEKIVNSTLDKEWERLMREAREIGMTVEEVSHFLREKTPKKSFHVYGTLVEQPNDLLSN